MDGTDLFRKLGVGAKFDFKRFNRDAQQLKVLIKLCNTSEFCVLVRRSE